MRHQRHGQFAPDRQRDGGANARSDGLLHRLRIADGKGRHILELLAQNFCQHARGVHGAARRGVVVMVQQDDGATGHLLGACHRRLQGLELVDKLFPRRPGLLQQLVAQALGCGHVVVGHDHHAQAGILNVGVGKAHKQTGTQRAFLLHGARHGLQRAVGLVLAALAHHMRNHGQAAPGLGGAGLTANHADQGASRALPGFIHVHMRVGLVARHHLCEFHHVGVDVGMHVVSDTDGGAGIDRANAAQQFAFAVFKAARHHGAVQVQQDAVKATGLHRLHDAARHGFKGVVFHRTAGRGMGGNGDFKIGAGFFCQVDESAGGRAGVAKGAHRMGALGRQPGGAMAARKARQVGDHGREGVGLVHHHGNQQAHAGSFLESDIAMIRARPASISHRGVSPATPGLPTPMRQ